MIDPSSCCVGGFYALVHDIGIGSYFATVDDPRTERTRHHALLNIMVIALAAIICGADRFDQQYRSILRCSVYTFVIAL